MKILFVNVYYYPDNLGGTERSLQLLSEGLVSKGHDVAVFCLSNDKKKHMETIKGVSVYRGTGGKYDVRVKTSGRGISVRKICNKIIEMNNLKCQKELENVLLTFKPDIVHTNNLNGLSTAVWKTLTKHNIPIVHTVRDYWVLSPTYGFRDNLLDKIYRKFQLRHSKYVEVVTGASTFVVDKLKSIGAFNKSKYVTIFNCVDYDKNELVSIIKKKRQRTGRTVFMYAGILTEAKGVDLLLKAIEKFEKGNIEFRFFGKGSLSEMIIDFSKKDSRVHYYGQVDSERIKQEYDDADVVLVPSIWDEPFGRVVIEGFSHGCTVIANAVGGIPEIIENMHAGKLCHNESEMIDAIKYYSDRKNLYKEFDYIVNNISIYHIDSNIASFEKVYIQELNG